MFQCYKGGLLRKGMYVGCSYNSENVHKINVLPFFSGYLNEGGHLNVPRFAKYMEELKKVIDIVAVI